MADIETGFYPKAQQNNLVDTLSTIQGIKNAQETNKLLQTNNQRATVGLSQDQTNLAHQQYGILSSTLGTLAQDPRIATPEGHGMLQAATQQLVKTGVIPQNIADAELANAPQDPAQLPQYLQTLNTRVLDGQQKFSAIYGAPGTLTNGSQTLPVTTSPITGIRPIGAPIDHTLSPETRADLVPTTDPQGRQVMVPKGNLLTQAGVDPMTAQPMAQPAQGNRLTAPAPGPVERRDLPPVSQNPPGGVVTSPPAGQVEAQKTAATASSERYSTDSARENNFQQNILPMHQAYQAIEALGPTGIGPGAEQINQVKSFMVSMGIPAVDAQKVNTFDEAQKYLTQMARQNGFTGSDAQLDAAQKASPSMKTSSGAAKAVLQKMIAITRMGNAQVRAFEATQQNPAEYNKWANDWNSKQNAVAYAFDLMSPEDRVGYVKTLNTEDRKKFASSLAGAVNLGLISPPSVK